ncbi:MAG: SCP2 sterol-binding domain-containing protein [Dehalococcoidia bacterium]|jgi:putative sterol carrier protein|nr:SCP2 sterol-binding domain-containing protein [Dehalococcoidia bacterium]
MTQQQMPSSIRELMELMPRAFRPERAQGVKAVVQFNFTGPEPGSWVLKVEEGKCEVQEGKADNPNVTINSPSDVWLKIVRRELDGAAAFMSGQFTFSGDMGVLLQMQNWFQM